MTTVIICLAIAAISLFGRPCLQTLADNAVDIDCKADSFILTCRHNECCSSRMFLNMDFCCPTDRPRCCEWGANNIYHRWCCRVDETCHIQPYQCIRGHVIIHSHYRPVTKSRYIPDLTRRSVVRTTQAACWPVQCHSISNPNIRWDCPQNATCHNGGRCRFTGIAAYAEFERTRHSNVCARNLSLLPGEYFNIEQINAMMIPGHLTRTELTAKLYYETDDDGLILLMRPKSKQNVIRQANESCWPVKCSKRSLRRQWSCPKNATCLGNSHCQFATAASRNWFELMIRTPVCAREVSIPPPVADTERMTQIENGRRVRVITSRGPDLFLTYFETWYEHDETR